VNGAHPPARSLFQFTNDGNASKAGGNDEVRRLASDEPTRGFIETRNTGSEEGRRKKPEPIVAERYFFEWEVQSAREGQNLVVVAAMGTEQRPHA
jgi:hypothetical protein